MVPDEPAVVPARPSVWIDDRYLLNVESSSLCRFLQLTRRSGGGRRWLPRCKADALLGDNNVNDNNIHVDQHTCHGGLHSKWVDYVLVHCWLNWVLGGQNWKQMLEI